MVSKYNGKNKGHFPNKLIVLSTTQIILVYTLDTLAYNKLISTYLKFYITEIFLFLFTNKMPTLMPDVGDIRGVGLQVSKLEGAGDSNSGMMRTYFLETYGHFGRRPSLFIARPITQLLHTFTYLLLH